jgi:hypothetical protein
MHLILCSLVMSSSRLGTRVLDESESRSLEIWRCMAVSKSRSMSNETEMELFVDG